MVAAARIGAVAQTYLYREAEKKNRFSFYELNTQCNLTKLLVNIIIDVIYLISGIYTNFRTFLCKKCDLGDYVINNGVYTRRSCCDKISASK